MNAQAQPKNELFDDFSLELLIDDISSAVNGKPGFGGTAKFVLSDMGSVYIDGSGDEIIVSEKSDASDCTLTTDSETFIGITAGTVDPVDALTTGKLTLEGDDAVAAKVGEILEDAAD